MSELQLLFNQWKPQKMLKLKPEEELSNNDQQMSLPAPQTRELAAKKQICAQIGFRGAV